MNIVDLSKQNAGRTLERIHFFDFPSHRHNDPEEDVSFRYFIHDLNYASNLTDHVLSAVILEPNQSHYLVISDYQRNTNSWIIPCLWEMPYTWSDWLFIATTYSYPDGSSLTPYAYLHFDIYCDRLIIKIYENAEAFIHDQPSDRVLLTPMLYLTAKRSIGDLWP